MKLVTAIVPERAKDDVREALREGGVRGATFSVVDGFGRRGGEVRIYRGAEHVVDDLPHVRVELAVPDRAEVDRVITLIARACRAGTAEGSGKVWVTDLEWVVSFRTGEAGAEAL